MECSSGVDTGAATAGALAVADAAAIEEDLPCALTTALEKCLGANEGPPARIRICASGFATQGPTLAMRIAIVMKDCRPQRSFILQIVNLSVRSNAREVLLLGKHVF